MSHYFVDGTGKRARRASDLVRLIAGAALLFWAGLNVDRISSMEDALVELTQSFPAWFDGVYNIAYFLGLFMVLALTVAAIAGGRKRLDLLRDIALALAVTLAAGVALGLAISGEVAHVFPEFNSAEPEPGFPVLRVAFVTSVIAVAAPHLTRPLRRLGWLLVILVSIAGLGLGFGFPSDVVGAVGLGLATASTVLLVFGSPRGYPNIAGIRDALGALGVEAEDLDVPVGQSWGVRRLVGRLVNGAAVEVKAYGRDAADSQWLARAWRTLWFRDQGQVFTSSRREGVEHEALATLIAAHGGVSVESVLAVGIGGDDVALVATTRTGHPLVPADLDAATLAAVWREVRAMHAAGIAHGALTLDALAVTEAGSVVRNFAVASLNSGEARTSLDVISLLYETAVVVGAEDAVDAAHATLGSEVLVAALPYLQRPALRRVQRKRASNPKQWIGDLRSAVIEATGAEPPEPAQLRRVNPKDLVLPVLSLVAAWALIGLLSDIDFAAVWDVMQTAEWVWIAVAFVIGQTVFFPRRRPA